MPEWRTLVDELYALYVSQGAAERDALLATLHHAAAELAPSPVASPRTRGRA